MCRMTFIFSPVDRAMLGEHAGYFERGFINSRNFFRCNFFSERMGYFGVLKDIPNCLWTPLAVNSPLQVTGSPPAILKYIISYALWNLTTDNINVNIG